MKQKTTLNNQYVKIGSKSEKEVLEVVKNLSKKLKQLQPKEQEMKHEYTRVF